MPVYRSYVCVQAYLDVCVCLCVCVYVCVCVCAFFLCHDLVNDTMIYSYSPLPHPPTSTNHSLLFPLHTVRAVLYVHHLCQLGKKPPLFTISDLPGYGHAVATNDEKRFWKTMIRDYLGTRQIISRYRM